MLIPTVNDKVDKKIKIYALAAFALTIAAIVLRIVCLEYFYDDEIGYYKDALLPKLLTILCLVSLAFFSSSCFFINRNTVCSDGKENNIIIKIASVICIIVSAVYFSISVFSTELVVSGIIFDLLSKISVLMVLAYFAINLFPSDSARTVQTIFGFGIVFFSIYVIAITYFDIYVQLNSPNKIMIHLAMIFAMIFFVGEFRHFVAIPKRRFYLFGACGSVFFTGAAAIPSLIKGISNGIESYKYFAYDLVILAFFIYSAARLISYAFSIGGKCYTEGKDGESNTADETESEA